MSVTRKTCSTPSCSLSAATNSRSARLVEQDGVAGASTTAKPVRGSTLFGALAQAAGDQPQQRMDGLEARARAPPRRGRGSRGGRTRSSPRSRRRTGVRPRYVCRCDRLAVGPLAGDGGLARAAGWRPRRCRGARTRGRRAMAVPCAARLARFSSTSLLVTRCSGGVRRLGVQQRSGVQRRARAGEEVDDERVGLVADDELRGSRGRRRRTSGTGRRRRSPSRAFSRLRCRRAAGVVARRGTTMVLARLAPRCSRLDDGPAASCRRCL